MGHVADILRHKGTEIHRIAPTASVQDAVVQMVDANVGSLLVVDGGEIVGIVTERDFLRRVALPARRAHDMEVREIMSSPVLTVTSETEIDECMALMTERRLRHLPVVDDGGLTGLVSIGDLVKAKSAEQSSHIRVLTDYITAR